jgi:hypothetical protein
MTAFIKNTQLTVVMRIFGIALSNQIRGTEVKLHTSKLQISEEDFLLPAGSQSHSPCSGGEKIFNAVAGI